MARTVCVLLDATDAARLAASPATAQAHPARLHHLSLGRAPERLQCGPAVGRQPSGRVALAAALHRGGRRWSTARQAASARDTISIRPEWLPRCWRRPARSRRARSRIELAGPWPALSGSRCAPCSGSGTRTGSSRIGWHVRGLARPRLRRQGRGCRRPLYSPPPTQWRPSMRRARSRLWSGFVPTGRSPPDIPPPRPTIIPVPAAILDVLAGTVVGRCIQRHRNGEFINFLNIRGRRPDGQGDPPHPC